METSANPSVQQQQQAEEGSAAGAAGEARSGELYVASAATHVLRGASGSIPRESPSSRDIPQINGGSRLASLGPHRAATPEDSSRMTVELLRRWAEMQPGSPSAPKLKAIEPERLTPKDAANAEALDDWIFTTEQMLQQQKLTAAPLHKQLEKIKLFWDLSMNRWWESASKVKQQQGSAITSWEQLQLLMRSNFLSFVNEDTAVAEMKRAEMRGKESMGEYTQRIAALHDRISEERLTPQMAAELLADGVQPVRFPLLVAAYRKEQAEHRKAQGGRGMAFDAVRERLMELSKAEPTEVVAATRKEQAAAASSGGNWPNHKGPKKPPAAAAAAQSLVKQLNAIAANVDGEGVEGEALSEAGKQFLQALVAGKPSSGGAATAPANPQLRCFRCQKMGHGIGECTQPDTRTCFKCGAQGHIARKCTSAPGGKPAAPETQPKNK